MEKTLIIIKKIIPKKIFKALQPVYHYLLSFVSALFYSFPSEDLIVVGITGTTGKTTSVFLMAKVLEEAGFKAGYTSTAMFNDGQREWLNEKKMTMVGRFFTQKILRDMVKNGCQYAIIETTSEGIRQFRHRFINYDILVFTGLYPEHIESHGSFENYKKAKGKLFAHLKRCKIKYLDQNKKIIKKASGLKKTDLNQIKKTIIVNGDDEHNDYFLNFWAEDKIIYTENKIQEKEDTHKKIIKYELFNTDFGSGFIFLNTRVKLNLLGKFNSANSMNAVCLGLSQGLTNDIIKKGLENIKDIPGRLEKIDEGQNFMVIVDYAFEPKALEKLYEVIDSLKHEKVIHVLGSTGGGRDVARRPKLGELAGKKADYVVVTNEDPYDDDPMIIIDQVALGAERMGKKNNKNLFRILDRKEAIKKALSLTRENDLVLITGKGSEQAICGPNGEKKEWDDRKVIRDLLSKKL